MTSRCFRARGVWSVWAGPGVPGAPHVSPGLLQQAAHRQAGLGLLLTGKDSARANGLIRKLSISLSVSQKYSQFYK